MTAQDAMTKFLDLILKEDIPQWMELWTEDAVFEYPFAPAGYPPALRGKDALFAHFRNFPQTITFTEFIEVEMHQTLDPNTLIVEFAGRGRMAASGKAYEQRYISVVRMRDGKIAHYKDYWNPLVVLEAFGNGEEQ